jgi:hypothetical protein
MFDNKNLPVWIISVFSSSACLLTPNLSACKESGPPALSAFQKCNLSAYLQSTYQANLSACQRVLPTCLSVYSSLIFLHFKESDPLPFCMFSNQTCLPAYQPNLSACQRFSYAFLQYSCIQYSNLFGLWNSNWSKFKDHLGKIRGRASKYCASLTDFAITLLWQRLKLQCLL